ncbi:hypothetical protein WJX81_000613 [Elliptochloris bilobata]|uniref:J domain-containing protein n=1 Tax=Elliptochloris bilobata TaxID=381761 RepID=A0AAW1RML8_9CHLO
MRLTREEAREVLGVDEDAEEDEIRRVYKKLALAHHPDKNAGREAEASEEFKKINACYQRLCIAEGESSDSEDDFADVYAQDPMEFFAHIFNMHMNMRGGRGGRGGPSPHIFMGGFGGPMFGFGVDPGGGGGRGGRFGGGGFSGGFGGGGFYGGGGGRRSGGGTSSFGRDFDDNESDNDNMGWYEEQPSFARRRQKAEQQQEQLRRRKQAQAEKDEEMREKRRQQREAAKAAKQAGRVKAAKASGQAPSDPAAEVAAAEVAAAAADPVLKSQLARPTQVEKGEASITLSVARAAWLSGDSEDTIKRGYEWELHLRAATDSAWRAVRSEGGSHRIIAAGLVPGTKYFFRARVVREGPTETQYGEYSVESSYTTQGHAGQPTAPPAVAAKQAPVGVQSKKGRRREAAEKRRGGGSGGGGSRSVFPDEGNINTEAEMAALQAQKEKEAATRLALERAAAEYAEEAARVAKEAREAEAKIAAKAAAKKPAARARAARRAEAPQESSAAAPPARDAPVGASAGASGSSSRAGCGSGAGGGSRAGYEGARPQQTTPAERQWSGGGSSAAAREEAELQEAIQLSLAMEESRRQHEAERQRAELEAAMQEDAPANGHMGPVPGRPTMAAPGEQGPRARSGSFPNGVDTPAAEPFGGQFDGRAPL